MDLKKLLRIFVVSAFVGLCAFLGQSNISLALAFNAAPVKTQSKTPPRYQVIGLADAIQFYYRTNVVFLDVRDTGYFKNGHIGGAINVIPGEIRNNGPLLSTLKQFQYCVVYCNNSSCGTAGASALMLSQLGITNLLVYSEGWEEWKA